MAPPSGKLGVVQAFYALKGVPPVTDLGSTIRSFLYAEADEGGVRHLYQDVVHAVNVDVGHPSLLHVLHDLVSSQGSVQTSIPI